MGLDSKRLHIVVVVSGVIVVTIVGFMLVNKKFPESASVTETITYSTDKPDEQKPDANTFVWKGQPDDPKYIRLPTIHAEGFIQNVGIDQNKAVAVPNNIHIAGWFTQSSRPGQAGLSIIDGHVDGRQNDGIFKNLANLVENDEFMVELGRGTVERFRVKKIISVDTARSVEVLFSRDPTLSSQLNLITCGGRFDQQTRQYDKRVIVVAELIT